MALNYTTAQVQLAQMLRMLRKRFAMVIQVRDADNANYDQRLLVATSAFSTTDNQERRVLNEISSYLDDTDVGAFISRFTGFRDKIESTEEGFFKILAEDMGINSEEKAFGAISYQYDEQLTDGTVAIKKRRGVLGTFWHKMVADGYYVVANVVTFGTFTAENGNGGTVAVTSMSCLGHTKTGTLRFECIDDTVDAPLFQVSVVFDKPLGDGTVQRVAEDKSLTCGKSFEHGEVGITCVLTVSGLAAPTESGDGGAMWASTTFTSPKAADSNHGIFYNKVTRQSAGDTWLIEFYSDDARTSKVGHSTVNGTSGTVAVSVTMNGGTVFASTFDKAAAATALPTAGNTDSDIKWDIDTPVEGDVYTRTNTNDEAGLYQTKTGDAWPISLPTSGATLFTDANASSISIS